MNFDPSKFDPSKMDPKVLMEISKLIQQLPPEKLSRMQTLMHNMAAGFDVRAEMAEFENSLPPGFREKMMALVGNPGWSDIATPSPKSEPTTAPTTVDEARLTILRAVAERQVSPEQALEMLFPPEP